MNKEIHGINSWNGEQVAPSSKSHAQRVLACSLFSEKTTVVHGLGDSEDEQAILHLIQEAGAVVEKKSGDELMISGFGFYPESALELNCGESGLGARMMTPILANSRFKVKLNGKGTLLNRSMSVFDDIMRELNVDFRSAEGRLPFEFQGPLVPKSLAIDGSMSSQFVTGIILGYVASPALRNEVLSIKNPTSVPYIELTLDVLSDFGVDLEFKDNKICFAGPYCLQSASITIEGDWSSASFLMVGAAILGTVTLRGLNIHSSQADIRILDALEKFGAALEVHEDQIKVSKKDNAAFEFDAAQCPDLFPPLAVLASFGNGISRISGVSRLKHKESDRAATIISELTKLGAVISIEGDDMLVSGAAHLHGAIIDPHGDHRIAMAAALMGLKAKGVTTITNAQVVNKSFPSFFGVLESLS